MEILNSMGVMVQGRYFMFEEQVNLHFDKHTPEYNHSTKYIFGTDEFLGGQDLLVARYLNVYEETLAGSGVLQEEKAGAIDCFTIISESLFARLPEKLQCCRMKAENLEALKQMMPAPSDAEAHVGEGIFEPDK